MALTHQITIHAAEGWAEINLAMDLMLLAAHEITMAVAVAVARSTSSSTKDNGIARRATAVGTTSMGTTNTVAGGVYSSIRIDRPKAPAAEAQNTEGAA
jgi:hypothetical protein